jgi:hypothetical protein
LVGTAALTVILVVAAISRFSDRIADIKKRVEPAEARVEYPYVSLHTFPEGVNKITIPLGPERWEGIALPLDVATYDVDATIWRQIKTWDGKLGPVLKKGQSAYMPVRRNRNISDATLWIRGEGEATVSVERRV